MFKLAFVNPPKNSPFLDTTAPPINLGLLASFIRANVKDIDMKIFDGFAGQNVYELLKGYKPNLVAITSTTPTILEAYKVADFCRKELGCKVVMGGVHVSVLPDEALQHCDIVVIGEGELSLLEIVNKMMNDEDITEKKIERPYIKNIDEIPPVAYDLMDTEFYIKYEKNCAEELGFAFPGARTLTLMTSRGCPNKCIFCHNSWRGSVVRYHSAKRVVDDMEYAIKKFNLDAIYFMDDEFLVNRERFEEICRLMKERNMEIIWMCNARADTVIDYGLEGLKMIKESGGTMIMMGLESGNERVLKMIKSGNASVEKNKEAIRLINKAGLMCGAMFVIGFPTETLEEIKDTMRFIKESDIVAGSICVATPYPGTVLYKMCLERGLITGKADYHRYDTNICAEKAYRICDSVSDKDFIKIHKEISAILGEKFLPHKLKHTSYTLMDAIKGGIKLNPIGLISYPFKHPINTLKILLRKA